MAVEEQAGRRDQITVLVMLVAIVALGLLTPPTGRVLAWLLSVGLMFACIVVAGRAVTGQRAGFLIDGRNKMSLSRLQIILWSLLVISAYLTAALANVRAGAADPLAIALPRELWLLMGISTASMLGSPLLLSNKAGQAADREQFKRIQAQMPADARERIAHVEKPEGKAAVLDMVVCYKSHEDACWSDLVKGEETGNAAHLDIAKVQMFFFTLVLIVAYAAALAQLFVEADGVVRGLPKVDPGMVTLLGISHTGYLAGKALPNSRSAT